MGSMSQDDVIFRRYHDITAFTRDWGGGVKTTEQTW